RFRHQRFGRYYSKSTPVKSFLAAILLMGTMALPSPQTAPGTVEGTVIHTGTGAVYPGVPISLGTQSTTTDNRGHFVFEGIAPGQYRLGVVSGTNFIGTSQTITVT